MDQIDDKLTQLANQGAIFYVNSSGGKDSQMTFLKVARLVPREQIQVVHADLGEMDWPDLPAHIEATSGAKPAIVKSHWDFFDLVVHRRRWPSPKMRYCTSDLKRGPIAKFIRSDMRQRNATTAVNCIGIRRQESTKRATMQPFGLNNALTIQSRTVYTAMPIFDMTTAQVFDGISAAGQSPYQAYDRGSHRVSCVICIMGCAQDLKLERYDFRLKHIPSS